jgi:hypothetical protein
MSSLTEFYLGQSPDYLGRRLEDVWRWDNDQLEDCHNYIQVLFPNREPSGVTPRAPVLDQETVDAFRRDERLRQNLARSLDLMLRFYGLEYDAATGRVGKRGDFERRAANWIRPLNHNYLRLTRILKCLVALGLEDRAWALFRCLEEIAAAHPREIGAAFAYWKEAVDGSTAV